MAITNDKDNQKVILKKLDEFNENMKRNSDDVEQLTNFSDLMRRQRYSKSLTVKELNMIKVESGNYRYGSKRL